MTAVRLIARDPVFRLIAVALALYACVAASIYPYLSLIVVDRVGMSEATLALVLALASATSVGASVLMGIVADQRSNRRQIALFTVSCFVLGSALMALIPTPASALLSHGILLPIGAAIMGQAFALNLLASQTHPSQREALQATMRAILSAAYLLMLLFWTWGLGVGGMDVMSVYASALVASLLLLVLIWRHWPGFGQSRWEDRPSGLNLRQAMTELLHPAMAARLLCMGAVGGLPMLYVILTPLLFAQASNREMSDVALLVGMVAGFEVPFMLLLPRLLRWFSRQTLIVVGAMIYGGFIILLALMANSPWVWALPCIAGLGAAPILTLPIGYWQDLMSGRPGTAAALQALQKLAGDLVSAVVFALGTSLYGYASAAVLGGLLAIAGALGLLIIDQKTQAALQNQ